ncbi:PREDICTED: protein N-lysine methyltransferase METTL21A-like [Branchiostoma belcheri]|uniref:Protein N-lysine methyltransferase METTL21A-like n=1 Tax=Branchiostoma belcheri TaxID=7741 RepID=A0A6P5A3F8_BRABE|nr:PREDICTED: protein N-lysine methyltransferase METTL21A-like [Branchiostoma belcheri]
MDFQQNAAETTCHSRDGNSNQADRRNDKSYALAVVPYDEDKLSPFHLAERRFRLAGRELVIRQSWRELGVAAVVWDAAVVLGEYLESEVSLTDQTVIELGAGTGLTGMVAALQGAKVTITEREIALASLRSNVETNIPPGTTRHPVVIQELTWGQNLHHYPTSFHYVLGADIIYLKKTFQDLLKTLVHLSNCETVVLLGCKIRYERDTNFLKMLEEKFEVKEVHYDQRRDIRVYKAGSDMYWRNERNK